MLGLEDIVGKRLESVGLVVVEELKVEERNLFAMFPIGATIQDGGKRKEAMIHSESTHYKKYQYTLSLHTTKTMVILNII